MAFSDVLTKANRLLELVVFFHRNPGRALTSAEIAGCLGIAERTARTYVLHLSSVGRLPVERHRRGWRLAEGARLPVPPVPFHLEEAAARLLAARLPLAEADEPNRGVADALARLAAVILEEVCPAVAARAAHGAAAPHVQFEPDLLKTVPANRAVWAIGRASPPGELRVLKLERVRGVEPTGARFDPPDREPILDSLSPAWGGWLGSEYPVDVTLRFAPEVAARVRETRWHPASASPRTPTVPSTSPCASPPPSGSSPGSAGGAATAASSPPAPSPRSWRGSVARRGRGREQDRCTLSEQPHGVGDVS